MAVIHVIPASLRRGGWLAVIGRAASPSEKKPHAHIVPRSEAARPKINLWKSSRSLRAKRRSLASALTACRAVRDSTLAACYRSRYAPRAGGAYDSHHRTAGIAGRTRRRDDGMAARGARARPNCPAD